MSDRQWARLAGVSGILVVVLSYAGVFLVDAGILGGLGEPPLSAGGEEFAHVLLAGDAEAREEDYMANGPYTRR